MRWSVLLLLACAFALRCLNLTFQPLWFDEGWSVWFATADLATMAARTAADIHPPLYYTLLHGWIALGGAGEFALRYFSVASGVLTVACLYRLARMLLGATTALMAAALMTLSPLMVYYSQEVRMYGLVTLLGVVSSWLFWKQVTRDKGQGTGSRETAIGWIAYVLVTSAAMYTQYYGAFIPLFHGVYWLCTIPRRRAILFPFIAFISLFILYLPWLLYVSTQLAQYVANKIGEEKYAPLSLVDYMSRHLVAFSLGHLDESVGPLAWLTVLVVALAVAGLWSLRARPTAPGGSPALFLLLYLLVPLAAGYVVQLRFPFAPPRMERLLLLAAPAFVVLVARGATVDLRFLIFDLRLANRKSKIKNLKSLALGVLSLILLASALSLVSFYSLPRYTDQDYRPTAERINALALPNDVVVLVHPWQVGFMQAYLRVPATLQMVADPAWGAADQAQLDAALAAGRRVWLPAYHALGAILESAMEAYLAQQGIAVEATWQQTTLLSFYAPRPPSAVLDSGRAATLGGLTLGALLRDTSHPLYAAGWGVIPVGFAATDTQNLKRSAHVSVRLEDQQAVVWAAQDRALETPEFMATHAWQAGLLVPAGTPPAIYQLTLTLYDAETQQPLGPALRVDDVVVVPPAVPPRLAALPIQTPLNVEWPDVRLLGYTLPGGAWRTGDTLHAELFWQARTATDPNVVTTLVVQDANGQTPARSDWHLWSRQEPMQPGELRREQREVLIPASLGAGTYRLALVRTRAGEDGREQVALSTIAVVTRLHQFSAPPLARLQEFRFGDVARLLGSDMTLDPKARTLRLRLYWRALSETQESYRVFVHVTRLDSPQPLAQHDGLPANGDQPTTSWVKGEYITDEHTLTLPPDMAPGAYRVLVGLYLPGNGQRLPAYASDGHEAADDALELATFELK